MQLDFSGTTENMVSKPQINEVMFFKLMYVEMIDFSHNKYFKL